ncbi:glycosyltransferase family 4 protein [Aminobacter anthyllidis]|nr:glycosyltransferase family 4 protein [Aminobacter anthyllidis]
MRVLITNLFVKGYSGSENVVELLATGLRRAGHQPMVYAPLLGSQADKLRQHGISVVDRVSQLNEMPDVIHAQQTTPCLIAMARFPNVPVVYSCHSSYFTVDAVMPHPQIREVIAVDERCAAKCREVGVAPERLSIVLNAVDLDRFARRGQLPQTPRKALLLTKNRGHLEKVRGACAKADLQLDELGPGTQNFNPAIETVLGDYDIVFATARMALEAAAVGCSVVVCDERGFAGRLTNANLPKWRLMNFGVGILTQPVTRDGLAQAIAQYDATDASAVTDELRLNVGLNDFIESHLDIYRRALSRPSPSPEASTLATAQWVEELAVTSATHRKWKAVAAELGIYDPPEAAISEQVIVEIISRQTDKIAQAETRQSVAIDDKLAKAETKQDRLLRAFDAKLAEGATRQSDMLLAIDSKLAELDKKLTGQKAGLELERRLKQVFVPKFLR